MISCIKHNINKYYNNAAATLKGFVQTHPSLSKNVALVTAVVGTYAIETYAKQAMPASKNTDPNLVYETTIHLPPVIAGVAMGAAGYAGKLASKAISKFSDFVFSGMERSNLFVKTALGAAHYPVVLAAGQAATLGGILAGIVKPEIYRDLFKMKIPKAAMFSDLRTMLTDVPAEEFLFRHLIQNVILKKGVSAVLGKCSPTLGEKYRNHTAGKIMRIALSSLVFSAAHSINIFMYPNHQNLVKYQYFNSFGVGLVLGYLQERTGNVWASFGAHAMFNVLQVLTRLE
jgi:membrane protease YdiL (CAAX protease family)